MRMKDTLKKIIFDQCGFILKEDMPVLIQHNRLMQVLIRTNMCRFVCAVQDAQHLMELVNGHPLDYVRDVSLPAKSCEEWKKRLPFMA